MNCRNSIDAAILSDYWLGILLRAEEDAVEEHLFTCDECGMRLGEVMALAEGVRRVGREGSLQLIVSEKFLKRAAEEGLHVSEYAPPPGGSVQCTVTAEDDLLVGRLAANLTGVKHVDLSMCDPNGVEQFRLTDIPFQPAAGAVLWQQSITFAKAAPTSTLIARMIAFDEVGEERLVSEYEFNHTRTLPGPGAW
jgi:anti-sigma factor RsiW